MSQPATLPLKTRGAQLLLVDDDPDVVDYLVEALEMAGYPTTGTTSTKEALAQQAAGQFDLVIADVEMPEMRGPDLLQAIHAQSPAQLVLLITAFGSIDLAVRALQLGACDFVTKPFRLEVLLLAIDRALREREMRRQIVRLKQSLSPTVRLNIPTRSPAMHRLLSIASRAAQSDATLLITGESGVGKGFVVRGIHNESPRRDGPFVQVNCAALPLPLVESELFGVRRGAFTDARENRPGLFAQAEGGTLLLDEIGELPMEAQAKLLLALETGSVRPVGGDREVPVNVRVVAATNEPLEASLKERRFRPDLYYRLNVIRLEIPPLRERRDDIPLLVDSMLPRISARAGGRVLGITSEALRQLERHDWPGNVRELANVLERAVALADHDTLVADDLGLRLADGDGKTQWLDQAAERGVPLAEVERAYILRVLDRAHGNKAEAARLLGIDRRTVHRKLNETPDDEAD